MERKTVFLTGASGSMGGEALQELLRRRGKFNITLLLLPLAREKKQFSKYEREKGIRIVWGNLADYHDVLEGVTGADYVLHVGALVSPAADRDPELTRQVNLGGTKNIIRAIKAQPGGAERIRLVNIASVAMTGDRLPPFHMGRVGDPIRPSVFDYYAVSKAAAEREVIDSGLKYRVSLRMSFIAVPNILSLLDPIMFHQPLETRSDLITPRDAGFMVVNACEDDVPDQFWGRVYNASGGPSTRFVYSQYICEVMERIGLGDFRALMERNWFCLKNFHCQYYEDSGDLESYLHFQRDSLEDHYRNIEQAAPLYLRPLQARILRCLLPKRLIKERVLKPLACSEHGPMGWIASGDESRIRAFYGSMERFAAIPDWGEDEPDSTDPPFIRLSHGYDERKPLLELADMREAAKFRGGECLSGTMIPGDLRTKLTWRCAFGHQFEASPYLILKAGHWCPKCMPPPWNRETPAQRNPFLAQL